MDNPPEMRNEIARDVCLALRSIFMQYTRKYPKAYVKDVVEAAGVGLYSALTQGAELPLPCSITMWLGEIILLTHDADHERIRELSKKAGLN